MIMQVELDQKVNLRGVFHDNERRIQVFRR